MTQPNNVLNIQKHYDSLIEEAAQEYSDHNYIDECVEIPAFKEGAIQMAQWKDEQFKHLLIEKTKLLSSSAAQDSVKRCTIEEIYRELFNEEMPNSNPYIK